MFVAKSLPIGKSLVGIAVCFCASTMIATPARAAVHLWNITEIFSNAEGTLQFIEMFTTSATQTRFDVQRSITVNPTVGSSRTFMVPLGLLPNTANRSLLFGTAGLAAAGGPTPDYIIPNNFLATGGGSIVYFGVGGAAPGTAYTAIPTNGLSSRNWATGTNNAVNSPTNFAGVTGSAIPEPTSLVLVSLALGSFCALSRRRAA